MDEQRNDSLSIEQCVPESTKYTQGLISFYISVFSKAKDSSGWINPVKSTLEVLADQKL